MEMSKSVRFLLALVVAACAFCAVANAAYNPRAVVSSTASPTTDRLTRFTGTLYNIEDSGLTNSDYVHITGTETITGDKDFTGVLSWNGTQVATSVASCADTDMTTIADGYTLQWNDAQGKWYPVVMPTQPSNYVTTDTDQTITGIKTFTGAVKNTGKVSYSTSTTISGVLDYVFCDVSGGSITLTLPVVDGKVWRFKVTAHASTNAVTLSPATGNIDGAASNSAILNALNTSCDVYCDGTNFWVY